MIEEFFEKVGDGRVRCRLCNETMLECYFAMHLFYEHRLQLMLQHPALFEKLKRRVLGDESQM